MDTIIFSVPFENVIKCINCAFCVFFYYYYFLIFISIEMEVMFFTAPHLKLLCSPCHYMTAASTPKAFPTERWGCHNALCYSVPRNAEFVGRFIV